MGYSLPDFFIASNNILVLIAFGIILGSSMVAVTAGFWSVILKRRAEQKIAAQEKTALELRANAKNLEKTSQKVFQEKENLNFILSSIGEGVVVFNNYYSVTLASQTAGILFRIAPDEMIGKDVREIFRCANSKNTPASKIFMDAMRRPEIIKVGVAEPMLCNDKSEKIFPVSMTVTSLVRNGAIVGAIAIFRDVTEEQEADRAKSEFISIASHQLQTPLATLNLYSELLSTEGKSLEEQQKSYLEEITRSVKRMSRLVKNLLDVSRVELKTFALTPTECNPVNIAEEILRELEPTIKEKGIRVEKIYPEQNSTIVLDPKVLDIVLQNLLTNAVKYTQPGGVVRLTITLKENSVLLTVSDSGCGVPSAQHKSIFQKFFRADNVKSVVSDGNGLGLYITKTVTEKAGGKISFHSAEGHGSTFKVSIPYQTIIKTIKDALKT